MSVGCSTVVVVVAPDCYPSKGGGSGGGRGSEGRLKKGKEEMKSETRPGRSHRSTGEREVGCEEHEKRCGTVCGSTPQEGQRGSGVLPIRARYGARDEQNPERSWDKVVR